jgi:simple sugar transport system ATP-binding protein
MVGRDIVLKIAKGRSQPKNIVLKVKNLTYSQGNVRPLLNQINFDIRKGEIIGIAGVEGNGQRELVEIITGLRAIEQGDVEISGQSIKGMTIREIRELGTAHIPQDRMTYGVAANANIEENLISDRFYKKDFHNGPLLNINLIHKFSKSLSSEYKIKCESPYQTVNMLSGGNIQKVVVAREISSNPEFLIADQPSRGIDIGSTKFIQKKIIELRDKGAAVLLISADLNEVMELSDSLLVFYSGEITAYFPDTAKITEEELGYYMLGLRKQNTEDLRGCIHDH